MGIRRPGLGDNSQARQVGSVGCDAALSTAAEPEPLVLALAEQEQQERQLAVR
jgi:hypothetical protein